MVAGGRYERNLHKFRFYTRALADLLVPDWFWRRKRAKLMAEFRQLDEVSKAAIEQRITYYNRLSQPFDPGVRLYGSGTFPTGASVPRITWTSSA